MGVGDRGRDSSRVEEMVNKRTVNDAFVSRGRAEQVDGGVE